MQHSFNVQDCKQFVEKEFNESVVPSLVDFIKIQNMSKGFHTTEEWNSYGWDKLQEAAKHILNWVLAAGVTGLKAEIISNREQNLTPIIFIEIEGQVDQTYFFYGHYDKQPPFVGWNQGFGAYTPVLVPAQNPIKLYGRGGADDGYSTYGSILAIKALQQQGIPIPRCVLLIEGDEESGTGDVEKHVQNLKQRIGNPKLVFCLDSGTLDYEHLYITTSLRGLAAVTVKIQVLKQGVHSGSSSGIVPSSFRIARQLIERIEDQDTGDMDKALNVDIPPNRYKELYQLVQEKGIEAIREFEVVGNLSRPSQNILETVLLNLWRAQLAVIGIDGLPPTAKAGNVTLPFTEVRLSVRLPPTKNPEEAKNYIIKKLTENPPYNAQISVSKILFATGFNAPEYPAQLQSALEQASQTYFGSSKLANGEGGSIPFMGFLNQTWPKAQFVVTGVLGPASNAHGPNEFLHLTYCKRLICSMAHILAKTVGRLP